MGVTNCVIQPQDWDEQGKGVKTDRLDATAMCLRLDRFVRGNKKAFSVVRVPAEEEERERAFFRQRQQIVRERQRVQAMGRSFGFPRHPRFRQMVERQNLEHRAQRSA